ncbi:MAG: hypoxanthine phosphoribosyltransferase [Chlorobi bacterium]|jgi:hypoxanthine phosphoribosyltransferase|nr:hypoxanthine phosphoribosyltransferase [Chlorobiota bacterium]
MKPGELSAQHSSGRNQPTLVIHDRTFELFIERTRIAQAVETIASAITHDYEGRDTVLVVVLKGAMPFAADLMRALGLPVRLEFIHASSYGAAMQSSGRVVLDSKLDSLHNRDVIIVEDIADSGTTIAAIIEHMERYLPRSLAVATLLSKPAVHGGRIPLQYVGIEIEPVFVVGYGLDYNELGRNLPDIYRLVT